MLRGEFLIGCGHGLTISRPDSIPKHSRPRFTRNRSGKCHHAHSLGSARFLGHHLDVRYVERCFSLDPATLRIFLAAPEMFPNGINTFDNYLPRFRVDAQHLTAPPLVVSGDYLNEIVASDLKMDLRAHLYDLLS
jgi:hypothetical protein